LGKLFIKLMKCMNLDHSLLFAVAKQRAVFALLQQAGASIKPL